MSTPTPNGVLLVDKPAGVTSHDVVAAARRGTGERRIGHAGTLDPFATGLLVLLVGRATRLAALAAVDPKVYEASVVFGVETDTDDLTGTPVREGPVPTDDAIRAAMTEFVGRIVQTPPDYSAKQVGGRRAYAAARKGTPLELTPVSVHVHAWEILSREGNVMHTRVRCDSGTYVRALARDLGRACDSAAHLGALRRTHCGQMHVANASSLDAVRAGEAPLLSPLSVLGDLPRSVLTADEVVMISTGRNIPAGGDDERAALVGADGALLAIAERAGSQWHPRVVLMGPDAA